MRVVVVVVAERGKEKGDAGKGQGSIINRVGFLLVLLAKKNVEGRKE